MADSQEDTQPEEEREFQKTIALIGDNAQDRGESVFWPCLSWPRGRGPRFQANNSSASRDRDDGECIEESIPLNTKSMASGCRADGASAGGDS
ncbi:uncharacterized protein LOC130529202 isoform X2 [Takifugu flavidus]|uniref:uncharacterized protein LOC130529202 isoform X2 n=1 Tax=Takifugu flavidus TaxID=433684 RepID=UPI0025441EC9|nr:uncharacterized protein LOC130529202 isoform X2 [Takifugu flavidus]